MDNWYNRIAGSNNVVQSAPLQQSMQFQNPIQKAQYILQTLTNPAAFVKQQFPDIPDNIANDPNQVLRYLQQSRGITNQQIQQLANRGGNQKW